MVMVAWIFCNNVYAQGTTKVSDSSISVFYGVKTLPSDDWSIDAIDMDISKQNEFGADVDFNIGGGIRFVVGILSAQADDEYTYSQADDLGMGWSDIMSVNLKAKGSTQEFRLGVRKVFDANPRFHPYIGAGLAYGKAKWEASGSVTGELYYYGSLSYSETFPMSTVIDSGTGIGYWAGGGVRFNITPAFFIGVDLSYSDISVEVDDVDFDAGGTHLVGVVGFNF